jgi:hypothetical protein
MLQLPPLGNASLSATSNQTSGDMEPYGCLSWFGQKEQSSIRVIKSAARVQWAEASLLVGSRGGLPDGDLHSVAPESTAKSQARCPAPPPPTLGSSLATLGRPVLPRSAGSDASPPGQALLLSPGVPFLPPGLPRTPKADVGPHPLLSNLPTYGWQRCAVDYSAIQFIKGPDGEPEELGSGASATVSQHAGITQAMHKQSRLPCSNTHVACTHPMLAGVPRAAQRGGAACSQGLPPRR